MAVPEGFHKSVGKPERQHIVDGALAEIVVDTKDVILVEDTKQNSVKFLRRCEIVSERLFHDDPRTPAAIRFRQMFNDGFKQNRRNCEVMRRAFRVFKFFPQRRERLWILIVAIHVPEQTDQLFESSGIDAAVFFQAIFGTSTKLIEIPSRLGDANDGNVEVPSLYHPLQGREDFLVRKVAGSAEEYERIRMQTRHECLSLCSLRFFLWLFQMSAESEAHRRQ